MLVGIADLSFLASEDFQGFLKETKHISFAMYSPLAWYLGYGLRGFVKNRFDETFKSLVEPFCRMRFKEVERVDINLMRKNLKLGINNDRILLVRNNFHRYYKEFYSLLDIKERNINFMAVRDLSNILLAAQLKLPLWIEKKAELWIKREYRFKMSKKSDLISLPFVSENPKYYLRNTLVRLITSFNQEVGLDEIVNKLKKKTERLIKIALKSKGIMLSTLEPLPVWDNLELKHRILLSAILTIIDVSGIKVIER